MHRNFVYAALKALDAVGSFTHVLILCETWRARQATGPDRARSGLALVDTLAGAMVC